MVCIMQRLVVKWLLMPDYQQYMIVAPAKALWAAFGDCEGGRKLMLRVELGW